MRSSVAVEIRELARSRVIAKRIGLITLDEMKCWADEQIRKHSEPPDFLFSISLGEDRELTFVERLDLVRDKPDDADCAPIAAEILDRLDSGKLDFAALELIALNCGDVLDRESSRWDVFSWIADELHLAGEGVKDRDSSYADVRAALRTMAG